MQSQNRICANKKKIRVIIWIGYRPEIKTINSQKTGLLRKLFEIKKQHKSKQDE